MPANKSCPTCHQAWAATFKFCPKDGTTLVESSVADVSTESRTIMTPVAAAPRDAGTRVPAGRSPIAAIDAAVGRAQTGNTKPRKAEPRLLNLAPVKVEAAPEQPVRAGPRKQGGFSETAWFMRPSQAVDPETGKVRFDPRAYERDDSIPEEKRRRFSLRRKDEE